MMPSHSILAVVAIAALASNAIAQEGRLLLQLYSPGLGGTIASGGYGRTVCTIGDVDGDGWQDIAVGHPTSYGQSTIGRIQLVSGLTGLAIRDCVSTTFGTFSPVNFLGMAVAAIGDIDGDQVPDFAGLGGASAGVLGSDIVLFSGQTGAVLQQLPMQAGYPCTAVAGVGDWDGDQVPDYAYTYGNVMIVASGATGSGIASAQGFVNALVSVADNVPGRRRLATIDNGFLILLGPSTYYWYKSGYARIADAGEHDGDGIGDLLAVPTSGSDLHILSGWDGSILRIVPGGAKPSMAGGVDLDGDTWADFVTGDPAGRGTVRAYSGYDGSLLFTREGQEFGESFGAALAMHPGVGASARTAVLVGVPDQFSGSEEVGALQVIGDTLPGEFDGSFRPFGPNCNYTSTRIRPIGVLPKIGQTFTFRFSNNTTPVGFELIAYGLSNTAWNGLPLPLVMPSTLSCQLLVSADILVSSSASSSYQNLAIPASPVGLGYTLYVQGWNVTGFPVLEASDAATLIIGN